MGFFDRFKGGFKTKKEKMKAAPASAKVGSASIKEKATVAKVEPPSDTRAHLVLRSPLVSEKAARIEPMGQYVFVVHRDANKVEIKKAVEHHYKVHVVHVNVVNSLGKTVRFGRTLGKQKDWRKAYVTLKKGQTLAY